MGDLGVDTVLQGGDGHWRATLSDDWAIWGPCGGYVATFMLRAAGAHSAFSRPATFTCHFLGVARFDEVDLRTETLRAGRRSESIRVSMTQDDRPICEAMVWAVDDSAGPAHDWTHPPDVPPPDGLPALEDLMPDGQAPFPFWDNLENRPLGWLGEEAWQAQRPLPPELQAWYRFRPTPTFDDPWLEAGRVAMLADIMGWPSASRAMDPADDGRWIAPNLDMSVTFHQPPDGAEWLLLDAGSPLATGGMIGAAGRVWAPDGRLLATSIQQMLSRETAAT